MLPCGLLLAPRSSAALSVSSPTFTGGTGVGFLVDQVRVREYKSSEEGRVSGRSRLDDLPASPRRSPDDDALSTGLVDEDPRDPKVLAEAFDRLMAEDMEVASIVQEKIKPGSLVETVKRSKGADVGSEAVLRKKTQDRQRSRTANIKKPSRTNKLEEATDSSKKQSLLTREQEYALARTIQRGAQAHKVKAEREEKGGFPISKKEWAEAAGVSPKELRKLVSEYRSAKQKLVSSNIGLVHAVARTYHARGGKRRGLSLDEIVQEGSLGLIRAAELFDPARGLRFSTYATIWIKGQLSNYHADDAVALPSRERNLHNKIRRAWHEMSEEVGGRGTSAARDPPLSSAGEVARRLGVEEEKVRNTLRRMACVRNVLSLDYRYAVSSRSGYGEDGRTTAMTELHAGADADLAERTGLRADLVAGLARNLSEREAALMRLRYGLGDGGRERTIKDCAAELGMNRETARRLQHSCLKKLREADDVRSLEEYLLTVA